MWHESAIYGSISVPVLVISVVVLAKCAMHQPNAECYVWGGEEGRRQL
jgi:hypothetical protein